MIDEGCSYRYIVREGLPFIKEMLPEYRRRYNRLSGRSKESCIKIITIKIITPTLIGKR
jgi:hypothetical protein